METGVYRLKMTPIKFTPRASAPEKDRSIAKYRCEYDGVFISNILLYGTGEFWPVQDVSGHIMNPSYDCSIVDWFKVGGVRETFLARKAAENG